MKYENLILDYSGAYLEAGFPAFLRRAGEPLSLLNLEPVEGTSCYCDAEAAATVRGMLAPFSPEGIHWIDSGDYHYSSVFFAEKIRKPYTLLLLDHHTDRQEAAFPGALSCGSWVGELLASDSRLMGVISVGPFPEPEWLGDPDPNGPLYVSVDKDILSADWARTNWDQGDWTLPQLLRCLASYWDKASEVIGIDICGELCARKGARPEDAVVNLNTNIEIQRFIKNYFKY